MSADNWAICPKCKQRIQREWDALNQKMKDAYGKVSEEEYKALLQEVEKGKPRFKRDLAEYVDVGMSDDGILLINYRAECKIPNCSFTYEYRNTIDVIKIEE